MEMGTDHKRTENNIYEDGDFVFLGSVSSSSRPSHSDRNTRLWGDGTCVV